MVVHLENLADLLSAALGELEEAIAVLDAESRVIFWNPAAVAISGYHSADLLSRKFPPDLYQINAPPKNISDAWHVSRHTPEAQSAPATPGRPVPVTLRHSQGHSLPGILRSTPLRDEMGKRFGTLLRFHPVEENDSLPHGLNEENDSSLTRVEQNQAEMEQRLEEAWRAWKTEAIPFGLLWIAVDQAALLRKSHGLDASEAMLTIAERTLVHGLRPTEILGRWGTHEFLVLSHQRTPQTLEAHARHLVDLARAADFHWWGDRIPLIIGIGAAQAGADDSLRSVLERAQQGVETDRN